jgi:hypothetical protein
MVAAHFCKNGNRRRLQLRGMQRICGASFCGPPETLDRDRLLCQVVALKATILLRGKGRGSVRSERPAWLRW